jgi:hypothetical protein
MEDLYRIIKPEVDRLKIRLLQRTQDFIYDMEVKDRVIIKQGRKLSQYRKEMEDFFNAEMAAFLALLGGLIHQAIMRSVDNFKEDGAEYEDVKYIEEALGIYDGEIKPYHNKKMTMLYALGTLLVIENDVVSLINNSFTGMVTRRDLWGAVERSINRKFYDFFETYAIGALYQSYNAAQVSFARKYDYDKFLYAGDIIEESRDFCVARAGLEFHRSEGELWNGLHWRGKIEGVDFFIQIGGYNCRHHLEWLKKEEDENQS